jgi:hypothetical protein
MKGRAVLIRSLLILLLPAGCLTPYYPPGGMGQGGHMVIDGFIDGSNNSALIKLSRSLQISSYENIPAETKASVTITASNGSEYKLTETKDGIYEGTNMSLDPLAHYTLHVHTQLGESYSSDEIDLVPTAEFDSISWTPGDKGVTWSVNAHSTEKGTGYYKWEFEETFQYNVPLFSNYKKVSKRPVFRNPDEYVYTCYASYPSAEVLISSTHGLAEDRVSMFPIYFIPKGSFKLAHVFRMTVTQVVITQDEYEFWEQIRKTTESLGGLFDPIPGSIPGNVHNDTDEHDPVLGYFSGGFPKVKVKYLGFQDLPPNLGIVDQPVFACALHELYLDELDKIKQDEVFIEQFGTPLKGYTVANEKCGDCRVLFGGTNVKPEDWPPF